MEQEGKYIYCIIGTQQDRDFGPIGIGAGAIDKDMNLNLGPLGVLT